MIMTRHDTLVYDNSTNWYICNEELGEDRVCDHCHLSGRFRCASHEVCNLKYKVPTFFPVVFHNISGYDSHLFIKNWEIEKMIFPVYQIMKKNYISFTKQVIIDKFVKKEGRKVNVKRELRFIDSLTFMASSLDIFLVIWKLINLLTWRNTIVVMS